MKKVIATAITTGLLVAAGLTAAEAGRDDAERAAWSQTVRNETAAPAASYNAAPSSVYEGRNAAVVDSQAAANGERAIIRAEQQDR